MGYSQKEECVLHLKVLRIIFYLNDDMTKKKKNGLNRPMATQFKKFEI